MTFILSSLQIVSNCLKKKGGGKGGKKKTEQSNPAEAVKIFQGEKILSTPSFGGEVKPSVPCRRFAACKRSLNVAWKLTFRQNYRPTFSPTVPPFAARISRVIRTWRSLAAEVGTSKITGWGGDKGHTINP